MNWKKIDLLQLPKDGTEFLVRNGNQGGVMSLVYWDVIHNYWKSKGEPISLQDTEWMSIPKFIPMCTYDCAKCGKDFQDELYPEGPQNLSDNYDFLCPECKKTEERSPDKQLKYNLLSLLREYRNHSEEYQKSGDRYELDEMNNKQQKIIEMFERTKREQAIINFISRTYWEDPENAIGEIRKRISEFEDLQIHAATSDFCSAEWKNDFEKVKVVIQKIYDAVNVSEDFPSEKILVIRNILEDYYGL
jgi:DNA-directed RNA polymerase subunit RPC12/RpoP